MNCSDATGALIDEEVKEMLKVAYDKAKRLLKTTEKLWTRLQNS